MRGTGIFLALALPLAAAEIVDRVVASVGLQVITGSAVRRQLKLDAFFTREQPEASGNGRRAVAERLLDQAILRREVELSRFAPPAMADTLAQVARLRAALKLDEAGFSAALKKAGIAEEALLEEVRWQIALFRFIEFRFRPAVQVSDEEVRVYYEGEFRREWEKSAPGATAPGLDEVRGQVVAVVTERKLQAALAEWLEQSRQQVKIRWHGEAPR